MDADIIYVLSSVGGIFICCLCSLISIRCLSICYRNNITDNVEPIRIEQYNRPIYQTTKYMPQDAVAVSMAGIK